MMPLFDEWRFLAGLGIFLFGMFMMEESIKLLSGKSFKTLIRRYTGTRVKGMISGLVSTAVLQSSSAVSLMVLAFVGAGLITLNNAIAVIMGAQVGTTLTAWIVALFGFTFKIEAFALPLIGIGGLGLILLASSPRYVNVSKLLAAFGFLFLGLEFMKTSVEDLAAAIDVAFLPDLGLWVYAVAGIVLTAVMQSSSATLAVILTTLFSGIIDFDQGAAMVIGANVGTTVTILLGAIGGTPAKKQVAVSSLVFNLGSAAVIFAALPAILWVIRHVFGPENNAVLGIALFHTLFNVMGVLIFFPFIPVLARFLMRLFPEKRTVFTRFIVNTSPEVTEAAIAALRGEVLNQLRLSMRYIAIRYRLLNPDGSGGSHVQTSEPEQGMSYEDLAHLHAEIFSFYAQVQAHEIEKNEILELESVIRASRSIMNATKNLFELLAEIEDIGGDDNPFMTGAYAHFKKRLGRLKDIEEKAMRPSLPDSGVLVFLEAFFADVENADKEFIRSCSHAVAAKTIRADEVTRLLMVNRLFTQANRMLVLSMRPLTERGDISEFSGSVMPQTAQNA